MILDWQTVIALMIVLAAAGGLALRVRSWVRGQAESGCGSSCQGCPAATGKQQLVQIQLGPKRH
jgi:hypothetical protein